MALILHPDVIKGPGYACQNRRVRLRTVDDRILTDYHQFLIIEDAVPDVDEEPSVDGNGLVTVRPSGLSVITGRQYGKVRVHIELHDDEPVLDLAGWDEVVEVSVSSVRGQLQLCELLGSPLDAFPNLAFRGPGSYRLRLSARGRDEPAHEQHAILHHQGRVVGGGQRAGVHAAPTAGVHMAVVRLHAEASRDDGAIRADLGAGRHDRADHPPGRAGGTG